MRPGATPSQRHRRPFPPPPGVHRLMLRTPARASSRAPRGLRRRPLCPAGARRAGGARRPARGEATGLQSQPRGGDAVHPLGRRRELRARTERRRGEPRSTGRSRTAPTPNRQRELLRARRARPRRRSRCRPGSSATTASMCVGISTPRCRSSPATRLAAPPCSASRCCSRTPPAPSARCRSAPVARCRPSWQPSLPLAGGREPAAAPARTRRTAVAFRFTPDAGGDWKIDDVYVDPWRHG